jgi:HAD superfamily hydrolase (TIGR01490 family)
MAAWAIFDIDGTLLPGTSMERIFWRCLLRRRQLPARNIFHFISRGLAGARKAGLEGFLKSNKSYVKGLSVSGVRLLAADCYRRRIVPRLAQKGKEAVESLRRQGYKIMIISGAPDFLADLLRVEYAPDLIISTGLEIDSGRYTGRMSTLHPYGQRKTNILAGLAEKGDLDFARSIAFADHHSDIPHLAMFGRAVVVNPKRRLRRYARGHGWKIVRW